MIMSALAGVAAALAVAILLSVYFRNGYRSRRDLLKLGLAASAVFVLLAFVISDMRNAALAYLGLNPANPRSSLKSACRSGADHRAVTSELLTDRTRSFAIRYRVR